MINEVIKHGYELVTVVVYQTELVAFLKKAL